MTFPFNATVLVRLVPDNWMFWVHAILVLGLFHPKFV